MREKPPGARAALGFRQLHEPQRIFYIVDRAQPGKQSFAIVLKHIAEFYVAERLAGKQDFTGIGRDQPRDHVDERALAAAVRSEDRDELPAWDVEVEAVVDDGVVEALAETADGDVGGGSIANGGAASLIPSIRVQSARPPARCRPAQNACKYFVTSTFCSSVPVSTEKSINF